MRFCAYFLATIMTIECCEAVAEENPHWLHIYHGAELACKAFYGENRYTREEQRILKKYCARLQHPVMWLQDQEWWQRNLPTYFQAEWLQRQAEWLQRNLPKATKKPKPDALENLHALEWKLDALEKKSDPFKKWLRDECNRSPSYCDLTEPDVKLAPPSGWVIEPDVPISGIPPSRARP